MEQAITKLQLIVRVRQPLIGLIRQHIATPVAKCFKIMNNLRELRQLLMQQQVEHRNKLAAWRQGLRLMDSHTMGQIGENMMVMQS